MGWIDELIEAEFASGKDPPKDPPEERKSKIKKLIREELNKNPVLSNVLRENKAEGKFIKELYNPNLTFIGSSNQKIIPKSSFSIK